MEFNLKSVFLGGLTALALVFTPTFLNLDSSRALAQRQSISAFLDLTADQEAALGEIRRSTFQDVKAVLTPAQQQQFVEQMDQGTNVGQAARGLDLSSEQVTQIRSTLRAAQAEALDILTPEQREELREALADR